MATKRLILLLLASFIQYLSSHATADPFAVQSSPVPLQGSRKLIDYKEHRKNLSNVGNGISDKNKIGHAFGGRGGNGGDAGSNGGGSHSPDQQGGAAVIPLYAGAANAHHNYHHSAASWTPSCTGTSIFLAAISLAHMFYFKV